MLISTDAYGLKFLVPANDPGVGEMLRTYGEFAKPESDLIISYMQGGGTYIDVGANLGTIALPVAAATGCRVIAIEAQRVIATILAANVCNNGLFGVDVIHAAAGAGIGTEAFPLALLEKRPTNFGAIGRHHPQAAQMPSETVRVCTLDEVAPADTGFVKIDVEGAEPDVLKGAQRVIAEVRPVWLLEANPKTMPQARDTMRTLLVAGYRLFWFYAPSWTPVAARPGPKQSTSGDMNFLALPEGAENTWDLPALLSAEETPPGRASDFRYLTQRYGFRF